MFLFGEQTQAAATLSASQVLLVSVPSLIALIGVLLSSIYGGRTAARAEERRAKAAIDAEDRRAQATIDAEDRRHEHAIALERQRITTASRHELYARIESARRAVMSTALELWLPPLKPHDWYASGKAGRDVEAFFSVYEALAEVNDEASLYGSQAVSEACNRVYFAANGVFLDANTMLEKGTVDAINDVQNRLQVLNAECNRLLTAMRTEVGSDA